MKKIIKRIGAIALSCLTAFCMTACDWSSEKTDGEFIFKYENLPNSGKCYSITGSTEEGQKYKENVYVPTHFNGLPVYYTFTSYTANGGALGTNTMRVNCKNLYFNCIQKTDFIFSGKAEYIFVPESSKNMSYIIGSLALRPTSRILYVSQLTYNYVKDRVFTSVNAERFSEINKYVIHYDFNGGQQEYFMTNANIAYLFNYKDSPNNNYFFINNFESEGLIEDTPYEPMRKGYTFAGWYKEPKCENIWNFEEDRLPKFEYDSEGYITNFVETKLYAKWIKN